ncbi:MAG: glycoside hydrolase, partial [Ruminococcus sp.]|nr:glycoside hydrolase [Ruminococcus sp.]
MHKNVFRKVSTALMAAALAVNCTAISPSFTSAADAAKYEFEDAVITGDITVEKDSSASGGSSLKMTESGSITLKFSVENTGTYNLTIYAGGIGGSKQQNMSLNGTSLGSLNIPESTGYEAITVQGVKLTKGENTLVISKSWGWTNFDYLQVEEAVLPEIKAKDTTPVDKLATKETKNLMSYLASVYGKNIISGQQEIYQYGPHGLEYEFEYLNDLTGHYPAIRGFDYGNFCCPAFGSDDGSTGRVIDWVKTRNGIATASFHINVPKDMKSYNIGDRIDWAQTTYSVKNNDGTEATNFVTSNAYKEGTKEYEYYRQALKTLAGEFKKLEAEGVPLIWRPLHEAEGGGGENQSWFWWGKEGSAVYKQLWIYTYETLTNDFGCHNLIWEWNSYNFDSSANWYPGDEYVDIIGYDKYNCTEYLQENNWKPS